jgi:hypothetical protein
VERPRESSFFEKSFQGQRCLMLRQDLVGFLFLELEKDVIADCSNGNFAFAPRWFDGFRVVMVCAFHEICFD